MASNPQRLNQRSDTTESEFYDNRRKAHRVLRKLDGKDRFNPFRHIAWFSNQSRDLESLKLQKRDRLDPTYSILGFQCKILRPSEPPEEKFTIANQVQRTFLTSWVNILLLCVPVGLILVHVRNAGPETFAINYVAEIPLWFMCDYALEEIEKYIGITATDILDIFTTNTVQIISSGLLLHARQVDMLQTSLIGGILSNILVLLGLSISLGGVKNRKNKDQFFKRTSAQGSSSLLSIAATSLLIPTAVKQLGQTNTRNLVVQSRGVAIVLLLLYLPYTFCQMWTHRNEYRASGKPKLIANTIYNITPTIVEPSNHDGADALKDPASALTTGLASPASLKSVSSRQATPLQSPSRQSTQSVETPEIEDHEVHGPQLDLPVATALFATTIVLLYFCIDATVNSISALTEQTALTQTFVGLILLPIPNCDFAPISLAVDDQLEQTMK
ncbi:Vacuolar cation/proton exchanger 1 [Cytospora mali]|uniref:Vacuolar cation/proton exchanger 1 n=1 Tax=Cytospora mali TaxID=578113 RepID=A0A194V595_CYTMA|nr:Vacuolar cation/proton exchanger 1 [Valsa mali var. pyri (nom. inval.)]